MNRPRSVGHAVRGCPESVGCSCRVVDIRLTQDVIVSPPSTMSVWPLMYVHRSLQRNTMAFATSCASPARPSGMRRSRSYFRARAEFIREHGIEDLFEM